MNERIDESGSRGVRVAVVLSLALLLSATLYWYFGTTSVSAQPAIDPEAEPTPQVVDESQCPLAETGLQGQVPIEDQLSGRSKQGYECGLTLVGQNKIEFIDPVDQQQKPRGGNFQLAYYEDCAYVGQAGQYTQPPELPDEQFDYQGIAVIDASNPTQPVRTDMLQSDDSRHQHESLEVHPGRGLLTAQIGGLAAQFIDFYDISADCTHPQFLGTYEIGDAVDGEGLNGDGETYGHGNRISPDGNTLYFTNLFQVSVGVGPPDALRALDISGVKDTDFTVEEIPLCPEKVPGTGCGWDPFLEPNTNGNLQTDPPGNDYGIHDLDVTPDGNTLIAGGVDVPIEGNEAQQHPNQVLLDVSKIQNRENPTVDLLDPDKQPLVDIKSESFSENYGHTEGYRVINGTTYGFVSGESPGSQSRCAPGAPGWGWGHVWDNTNLLDPVEASEIKLEVNHSRNCVETNLDQVTYSIHYDGADNDYFLDRQDAVTQVQFYTWYGAGLRAFDVRDPANPKEIAYYHPKPVPQTIFTEDLTDTPPPYDFSTRKPEWDSATSNVRFRPETGEIWVVSVGGGFQILKFTKNGTNDCATLPDDLRPKCLENGGTDKPDKDKKNKKKGKKGTKGKKGDKDENGKKGRHGRDGREEG